MCACHAQFNEINKYHARHYIVADAIIRHSRYMAYCCWATEILLHCVASQTFMMSLTNEFLKF